MKNKWLIMVCLLVVVLVAVGCAPAKAPTPKAEVPAGFRSIRMVGSSLGGRFCTVVMTLAAVFNKYYPEIEWSSCSGATITTAIYLTKGEIKLGMTQAPSYIDAFGFDTIPQSRLRSINMPQPPSQFFFLIPEDKPWKDITEVPRGLTLCPGTPGTATAIACETWLKVAGLSKKDFNWVPLGRAEAIDAWRANKLDLYFASVGGMDAFFQEIQTTPRKIKAMGMSPEQVAKAKAEQTFESLGFPRVATTNVAEIIPELFKYNVVCPQQPAYLCSRDDFPQEIAYKMAKVTDERRAQLAEIFASMSYATPENHIKWAAPPTDIHPGVARYYREKGYLK